MLVKSQGANKSKSMMTCSTGKIWAKWISERERSLLKKIKTSTRSELLAEILVRNGRSGVATWAGISHKDSKGETEKLVDGGTWIFREGSLSGIK